LAFWTTLNPLIQHEMKLIISLKICWSWDYCENQRDKGPLH
jgi:hypothetical protein